MRTGRPKKSLTVKPADQEKLELLARRPKTAQRVAIRSKIVLRAAVGLSNQEIAVRLFISLSTAKVHVHHIFEKLEVRSRAEAAIRAASYEEL